MEAVAKVPLGDVRLEDAKDAVEDSSWFFITMPPVLFHYRLSIAEYWALRTYEHRLMVDYLVEKGLLDG